MEFLAFVFTNRASAAPARKRHDGPCIHSARLAVLRIGLPKPYAAAIHRDIDCRDGGVTARTNPQTTTTDSAAMIEAAIRSNDRTACEATPRFSRQHAVVHCDALSGIKTERIA